MREKYTMISGIVVFTLIAVTACNSPLGESLGTQLRVQNPEFNIEPGTYDEDIQVELATPTEDAVVRYTLDGSNPTVSGEIYGGPIEVAGNGTIVDISAYATREGMQPSEVVRGRFEIAYAAAEPPVFSIQPDRYAADQTLEITTATEGAEILFTLNGTDPLGETGEPYQDPVLLTGPDETYNVRAIARKDGMSVSDEAQGEFVISYDELPPPTFVTADGTPLEPGDFPDDLSLYLAAPVENAQIYYTVTDGPSGTAPDPTNDATKPYTGDPISITEDDTTLTVQAITTKDGFVQSEPVSGTFSIDYSLNQFTLTVEASDDGTVNDETATTDYAVTYGEAFTIIADPDEGYRFVEWEVDSGAGVDIADPADPSTSVTLTGGDATVRPLFEPIEHTLTVETDGNGTVDPAGAVTAQYGAARTVTASAAAGYVFDRWEVVDGDTNLTLDAPTSASTSATLEGGDATIRATFVLKTYTLTIEDDGNGSTSPSGTNPATHGQPFAVTATPDSEYSFVEWVVTAGSGVTIADATAPETTVTLTDGAATIQATFEDSAAPTAPSRPDLSAFDDTGTSSSDDITSRTTGLTFSGTAEAGAIVTLRSSVDGTIGTTTSSSGTWSITSSSATPLSAGNHAITATATDSAGNTSSVSDVLALTIDTDAPSISSFTINNATSTPNDTHDLSVTLYPGVGSDAHQMRFRNADGSWSSWHASSSSHTWDLSATGGEGNRTVYVEVRDLAGLSGSASETIEYDILPSIEFMELRDQTDGRTDRTDAIDVIVYTGDATDVHEMRIRNDGATYSVVGAFSHSRSWELPVGPGSKTVEVTYFDDDGNSTTTYTDSIQYLPAFGNIDASEIQYVSEGSFSSAALELRHTSGGMLSSGSILMFQGTSGGNLGKIRINSYDSTTGAYVDIVTFNTAGDVVFSDSNLFMHDPAFDQSSDHYYNAETGAASTSSDSTLEFRITGETEVVPPIYEYDYLKMTPMNATEVHVYYEP
mgnify:CR=1 FL=1